MEAETSSQSASGQLPTRAGWDGCAAVPEAVRALADILRDAGEAIPDRSPSIKALNVRLRQLSDRVATGHLQLAIVGQFKRGKSTLINALLGQTILPAAVTPLTAIPTFIRAGTAPELVAQYLAGPSERLSVADAPALAALLAERVTEEANPRNRAGIARVEARLSAPLLQAGLVLIDTPGIGSTFKHNTETAKATLPECDVALFVVSPDPSITEIELAYLEEVAAITPNIIIVLNKIDLVDGEDRLRSEKFLAETVRGAVQSATPWLFSASARQGLKAKAEKDNTALAASGILALERFLITFANAKGRAALEGAARKNAKDLITQLLFELDTRRAVLGMPVADLSHRLEQFVAAEKAFEAERRLSHDLLAGDANRLLGELDEDAAALRSAILDSLVAAADRAVAQGEPEATLAAGNADAVPKLFQAQLEAFENRAREALVSVLRRSQDRGDVLIAKVRALAATLLAIPFAAPLAEDAFEVRRVPYWVTIPRQSFIALPLAIESLLPATIRLERVRRRLRAQLREIATRNVENLRWALRQNLEGALRSFEAALDTRLSQAQEATRSAMQIGLSRRSVVEAEIESELDSLAGGKARLQSIMTCLEDEWATVGG